MNRSASAAGPYHRRFSGDTYDACARCGGKCEQYKISALMPGESEYMAARLRLKLGDLQHRYLDRLDTPYGPVDVLKMKDGCPFLDREFHCTAGTARPVLCDSYPIAFRVGRRSVGFFLDDGFCPMVRWPEYARTIEAFANKGTEALRSLHVPIRWWRTVALFDEFDIDYKRIERVLRAGPGYETFLLEEILAFACNGLEEKARRRGLRLLEMRLRTSRDHALDGVDRSARSGPGYAGLLARAFKARVREECRGALAVTAEARGESALLLEKGAKQYRAVVAQVIQVVRRLSDDSRSYAARVREAAHLPARAWSGSGESSRPVRCAAPSFLLRSTKRPAGLKAAEVIGEDGKDAREGYSLLAATFAPDEIDGPGIHRVLLRRGRLGRRSVFTIDRDGEQRRIWHRWIQLVVRDQLGRLLAVRDGAVIADPETTLFYASHVVTREGFHSRDIGSWLAALSLQVANDHLLEAERALGCTFRRVGPDGIMLTHEICELEFPDPNSKDRLGKLA